MKKEPKLTIVDEEKEDFKEMFEAKMFEPLKSYNEKCKKLLSNIKKK